MAIRRLLVVLLAFGAALALPVFARDAGVERLERSLKLDPLQQHQFDVALQATQRAMITIGLGALQFKTRLGMELLKDRPDPKALTQLQDEVVELARPQVRAARDEWMRFYAMLDGEQSAAAQAFMEEKLRKLDQVAEALIRELTASAPKRKREPLQE